MNEHTSMNLNEQFYYEIQRMADTPSQGISADVVSRVLSCAAEYLCRLPTELAVAVIAAWLEKGRKDVFGVGDS